VARSNSGDRGLDAKGMVIVASRPLLISSFKTIRTLFPFASGAIAVRVACKRLSGPLALIAVEGRIDPTRTARWSSLNVRFSGYAVACERAPAMRHDDTGDGRVREDGAERFAMVSQFSPIAQFPADRNGPSE
jgi:hypothetical protein